MSDYEPPVLDAPAYERSPPQLDAPVKKSESLPSDDGNLGLHGAAFLVGMVDILLSIKKRSP